MASEETLLLKNWAEYPEWQLHKRPLGGGVSLRPILSSLHNFRILSRICGISVFSALFKRVVGKPMHVLVTRFVQQPDKPARKT